MRYPNIIIFVVLIFSLSNCEKNAEFQSKNYPYVVTKAPIVSKEGAELVADISDLGDLEILKYGFVWSKDPKPSIQNSSKLLEEKPRTGIYSYSVKSGLALGVTYYVRAYILTDQYEVYGNEKSFVSQGSLPPEIKNFDPKFGAIGAQIIIEGENFGSSKTDNVVKFGNTEVIVDSVLEKSILITIPKITKPERVQISVETGGMTATSQDSFELWFPWAQKKDFGGIGYYAASFSIGDTGYVINRKSKTMLTYDPVKDDWQNNISLPEYSGDKPMAFSLAEAAYVLLEKDFWEYNSLSNEWIKKADFPGTLQDDRRYIFGLKIGSNIYLGNCYKSYEFWEYNSVQDSWLRKADFTETIDISIPVFGNYTFTLNDIGYLGITQSAFGRKTLWQYDPIQNVWTYRSGCPSDALNFYCSFVINDKAFVGLGSSFEWSDGYVYNKIWKYDLQIDRWIQYHDCPVYMTANASFSINNKAYIASGYTKFEEDLNNVWEFDPSKN